MIVVAHPDDEVIGVGAQLHRWASRVHCVYATDGAPADGADAQRAGFGSADEYARVRAAESDAALAIAGVTPDRIHRLSFVDQTLAARLLDLDEQLGTLLRALRPDVVITHAYEGGHPDHDALSVVLAALAAEDRNGAPSFDILEFAGYAEGAHGCLVTNAFATASEGPTRCVPLSRLEQQRKRAMLACFRTQQHVLQPFRTSQECLRVPPAYDYVAPPNGGRVWYDRLGWRMTSHEWSRLAARYLRTRRDLDLIGARAQC